MSPEHDWIQRIEGSSGAGGEPQPSPQELLLREARLKYAHFRTRYEKTVNAYFGTSGIPFTMEPGGWYIDLEKPAVNADPKFFLDQGYSESESIYATFHEAEHFRAMAEDPQAYEYLFQRLNAKTDVHPSYPAAAKRFYNCIDDVGRNRVVSNRWSAGRTVEGSLYRDKLFPNTDLRMGGKPSTKQPRHRQLMYAVLREAMLPDEPVEVDDEVRAAITAWQARGGARKAIDILTAVDPRGRTRLPLGDFFARIKATLEPVFEAFFRQDLLDRQAAPKEGGSGKGEKGDGDFGEDPFASAIPDPIDFDKVAEGIRNIRAAAKKKNDDDFKDTMGVEQEDYDAYLEDYRAVEPYVESLSKVFDDVIERRKSYRRVLRKSVREGPMLDQRKAATAVAEVKAGNLEPFVMLDFERREQIKNLPDEFEISFVFDGSGSMKTDSAKVAMQRRLAILGLEAFVRFHERLQKERRRGENITLHVKSEARIFSDTDETVKPLSESLTHVERVKLHKRLNDLPGGGNNEPDTFDAIEREQFNSQRNDKLRSGRLKKVIIFFTDGETDQQAVQDKIRGLQKLAGLTKQGKSNLVVAGIGFDKGIQAKETYAPNGFYAETFDQVREIFEKFISEILDDV